MVEGNFQNIQIIGDLLKAAIPAPLTGGTETVVLGQEKFHDLSPVAADLGTVGIKHHPLGYHVIARGNQPLLSLQLHHTDAAGGDLVDIL